ncbi:MAG: hypothetical protein Q8N37_00390 [bacterium]|nr:hypothetical protein [bacterium]
MSTEQQKIRLAKIAFERFLQKIILLLGEEKQLFERIMGKIEQRKINECRGKICEIYKNK